MLDSLDTLIAFALTFTIVSLLITIAVQIISSVFNLRGHNLSWGVAEAFEVISPNLKATVKGDAKKLADHLLKDDLLSDSQFWFLPTSRAKAVRPDELFALMHRVVIGRRPGASDDILANVRTLLKGLGVPDWVFHASDVHGTEWATRKGVLETQLATLTDKKEKPRVQAEIERLRTRIESIANTVDGVAIRWASLGEQEIQRIYQNFEHWFQIGQERSQEWFTTHTRVITGILGVIAAFALQLDTIEIYQFFSSNRDARERLVAQTKAVVEQGERVFSGQNQPQVLEAALSQVRSTNGFFGTVVVAAGDTVGAVRDKIRNAAAGRSPGDVEKLLKDFDDQTLAVVQTNLALYRSQYTDVSRLLDKTGFTLFPAEGARWKHEGTWRLSNPRPWLGHVFGMLFSALLLSLGAPFWFNTLKSLASLRSSVGKNIWDEDKSTTSEKSSKAPPTVM